MCGPSLFYFFNGMHGGMSIGVIMKEVKEMCMDIVKLLWWWLTMVSEMRFKEVVWNAVTLFAVFGIFYFEKGSNPYGWCEFYISIYGVVCIFLYWWRKPTTVKIRRAGCEAYSEGTDLFTAIQYGVPKGDGFCCNAARDTHKA